MKCTKGAMKCTRISSIPPGFVSYGSHGQKPKSNLDSLITESKEFFHSFPDWKGEDLKAVAFGDTVLVMGTWSGTCKNDFPNMKANGKNLMVENEGKPLSAI